MLDGADLVVTGEGRIDGQSVYGMFLLASVNDMAKDVKVIAIVVLP